MIHGRFNLVILFIILRLVQIEFRSTILEVFMGMGLLFAVVGWSALGGLAVMLLTIPLGAVATRYLDKYQKQILEAKDERMAVMDEILNGIRILKVNRVF